MEANILSDRVQFISKAETVTFRGLDMLSGNVQNTSVPPSATVRPTVRIILAPEMLAAYPSGYYDVDLRVITNQPTWTEKPSTEGAFNCLDDLTPLFRKEPSSSGGGQVDTIVPGDAIDVDSTDPANPIVNVKVDGVTMLVNGSNELEAVASGGITQLTGPVTAGPGSGSQATTITNGAVTFAKMQPVSANILLGNDAAGTAVEEIPCTPFARTILDDVDAAAVRATIGAGTGTGTVTAVSVASANGLAGSSSGGATPALTLSTTITGILSGNGTAISAASTTGSGSVVLATSPTLVTPALGTPSGGVLTNCTGLPLAGLTGGADDDVAQRKAGAWTSRTLAQYLTDQTPGIRNLFASTVLTYTGGNQNTTSASLANVHSSAAFTISNAGEYEFEFYVTYDVGATSTGIQLSVSGTTTFSYLNTLVSYSVLSTDRSTTQFDAYDGGRPASSSATTTANGAIVKGSIIATAGGSLNLRFASEGAGLSVTITNVIGKIMRTS